MFKRDLKVLELIIADYISNAAPVGSGAISRTFRPSLSPATIRNIMSDLTDLGLLSQPHTSAGRLPTELGLRFYVDSLLKFGDLSKADSEHIREKFAKSDGELKSVLTLASKTLSSLSHHVSIVAAPAWNDVEFKQIEFLRLSRGRLLGIFVGMDGRVQNRIVEVTEDYNFSELEKINNYCNRAFMGLTLDQARQKIQRELREQQIYYDKLLTKAFVFADEFLMKMPKSEVFIEGKSNLVDAEKKSHIEKLKEIIEALEEGENILKLIERAKSSEGVKVFIGSEVGGEPMNEMSAVTATYARDGKTIGTLGVIGPTHMDYSRVISIVDFTAKLISDILSTKEK